MGLIRIMKRYILHFPLHVYSDPQATHAISFIVLLITDEGPSVSLFNTNMVFCNISLHSVLKY